MREIEMSESSTQVVTLAERELALRERTLYLEERKLANEMRIARSPEEAAFELEMRMAKALADSPFLPEKVGKNDHERTAAAWGVIRYANLLKVDPYVLAQQIYVVHGRVGWWTSFLISLVNERAGLKEDIDWTVTGEGKSLRVIAHAVDKNGKARSADLDWPTVERWSWATKSDPWKADPVQMMKYRTAAKLIRNYFGAATMGLAAMTAEELRDLPETSVEVQQAPRVAIPARTLAIGQDAPVRDYHAEAEEAEARRIAALEEAAKGTTEPTRTEPTRTEPANPLAGVPDPTGDWITALAEEVQTDTASIVAYLRSVERDPATMSPQQSGATKLALGASGSKRADLLAFVGRK